MQLIVHVSGYWSGWIEVKSPPPLAVSWIRALKSHHRQFVENSWYVLLRYEPELRTFLAPGENNTNPYAILHLLPSAPDAIVKAVWRELVKTLHPDQGGDNALFLQAKTAYEKIMSKQ